MNQSFKVFTENQIFILNFQLINQNQAKFDSVPLSVDETKSKWCRYRSIIFLDYLHIDDVLNLYHFKIDSEGWFSGRITRRSENGKMALSLNFRDGKLCGINRWWYEDKPSQLRFKVDVEGGREWSFYSTGKILEFVIHKRKATKHNIYYAKKELLKQVIYYSPVYVTGITVRHGGRFSCLKNLGLHYTNIYTYYGKLYTTIRTKGLYAFEKCWDNDGIYKYIQFKKTIHAPSTLPNYHGIHLLRTGPANFMLELNIYKNNKKRVEIYRNNRRVIFTLPNTPKGIVNTIKIK